MGENMPSVKGVWPGDGACARDIDRASMAEPDLTFIGPAGGVCPPAAAAAAAAADDIPPDENRLSICGVGASSARSISTLVSSATGLL
jgi:hypothetical protein